MGCILGKVSCQSRGTMLSLTCFLSPTLENHKTIYKWLWQQCSARNFVHLCLNGVKIQFLGHTSRPSINWCIFVLHSPTIQYSTVLLLCLQMVTRIRLLFHYMKNNYFIFVLLSCSIFRMHCLYIKSNSEHRCICVKKQTNWQ